MSRVDEKTVSGEGQVLTKGDLRVGLVAFLGVFGAGFTHGWDLLCRAVESHTWNHSWSLTGVVVPPLGTSAGLSFGEYVLLLSVPRDSEVTHPEARFQPQRHRPCA